MERRSDELAHSAVKLFLRFHQIASTYPTMHLGSTGDGPGTDVSAVRRSHLLVKSQRRSAAASRVI